MCFPGKIVVDEGEFAVPQEEIIMLLHIYN